ncbi:MAG: folylpolyglutamate synthase/dihydrofolate synthase family protein [Pseudomonadota bacterium]
MAAVPAPPPAGDARASDLILQRLMTLHPKIIDLTLDRVWRLLDRLGNPQRALPPVVHVAGTNGKGSTVAMLRAGLEGAGARAHAYTSPHLVRFHERIRLAGRLIDEDALAALLEECEAANGAEAITYFEITTVAALLAFAREPADWTLLEVGLGGRLDATNVIVPRLAVITPVSMDHQQYLGDTLAKIAGEKAGVLKPGVPAVIAPQAPEAMAVIETRAAAIGAPLTVAGRDWTVALDGETLVYESPAGTRRLPRPALPGAHQVENAGTALAALEALGAGDAAAAMAGAEWPARLQRLDRGPVARACGAGITAWLDGGHNPAAGEALAAHFAGRAGRLHLVLGMLDTKDATRFAAPLARLAASATTLTIPGAEASLTAEALAARLAEAGLPATPAATLDTALAEAARHARPGDDLLVCGSLYLAGAVLARD